MVAVPPLCLNANNPGAMTGRGNNTWLIDGAEPTLIDAGVGDAAHIDAIANALGGRALVRVLVTHGHSDHASGVPSLRERWPNLQACKFQVSVEPGWISLDDEQNMRAGDSQFAVIHTPGHALDHVCFWNLETRELYAGDLVAKGTTVMIPAGRGGGLRAYLDSLRRVAALVPQRILPGHGPVIDNPAELIAEFIAHREMREAQVRSCLERGIRDVSPMVAEIYPGLDERLIPAARATIEAHLEKLREDGIQ